MFCGRLGNKVMAGYGLASAVSGPLCKTMTAWGCFQCREEHITTINSPYHHSFFQCTLLLITKSIQCFYLWITSDSFKCVSYSFQTINITTAATGCGLALACNTFVSQVWNYWPELTEHFIILLFSNMINIVCDVMQTFGAKNLLRVGVILQRGIIILLLFCLPCWGLLINAEAILLCLGQEAEVAR